MTGWGSIRAIPVGGLVAVGFLDERRVVVGSHSGLGVFDAASGAVIDRAPDPGGKCGWFRDSPPSAVFTGDDGQRSVSVAGLWGGTLPDVTGDGWTCWFDGTGAALAGPDGTLIAVDDDEEPRACGFSPLGQVFVFATSPTLHVAVRSST